MIYITYITVSIILQSGNTILDQGITTEWPQDAFPDSILEILITTPPDSLKALYDESTSAFNAFSLDGITANYFLFTVENDPLSINPDISYTFTIPIPTDLLTNCPDDYGYEIFTYEEQTGFGTESWPLMVLYESTYNDVDKTLTAQFYPEMWINKQAEILLSCTPGANTVSTRRRLQGGGTSTVAVAVTSNECHAGPISCPIPLKLQTDQCQVLLSYSRTHIGVDYESTDPNGNILAAATGVVEKSEHSQYYGEIIIIRHQDGSATVYKNLDNNARLVQVNDNVVEGETIIGRASGHLHLEYIPNGMVYSRKGYINAHSCVELEDVESGSIEVSDSGTAADDAFAMYINGFYICETELGQLNKCTISNLKCGEHELMIKIIAAPDGYGTWLVKLNNGWLFDDGTDVRNNFEDGNIAREPEGHEETWNIIVPCTTEDTLSSFVP